jgi:hypothetical protein
MHPQHLVALLLPVLALAACAGSADSPPPRRLLLGSYLLADGDLFATRDEGISASVQRPIKATPLAPLIKPDYPWEGTMHMYGSVVTLALDDVRIYYSCNMGAKAAPKNADGVSSCCVAISRDGGLTFTKPLLPGIHYENHTKTNIVFTTNDGLFDSMLALPPGMPAPLGAPAGTRLLLAFDDGSTDTKERAMQLAVSADGYRFDRLAVPTRQLPTSFADTSVSLSFDPLSREFVALGRMDGAPDQHPEQRCGTFPPPANWNMHSVRGVRRAASPAAAGGVPSLLNFSLSKELPFAFDKLDQQCLDVYNSAAFVASSALASRSSTTQHEPAAGQLQLQQMERAYLAFPAVYLHYGEEENNGVLDVRFAFSRNGTRFRYIDDDRRAFVPRGIGAPDLSLRARGLEPSLVDQLDDGVTARWDAGMTCVPPRPPLMHQLHASVVARHVAFDF